MPFPRPCKRCNMRFQPKGRFKRICEPCQIKARVMRRKEPIIDYRRKKAIKLDISEKEILKAEYRFYRRKLVARLSGLKQWEHRSDYTYERVMNEKAYLEMKLNAMERRARDLRLE